jgi:hypothetical protein
MSAKPSLSLPRLNSIQWFAQVSIPLVVLAAYCVAFRWLVVAYRPLPAGVNLNFVQNLLPLALLVAALAAALALLFKQRVALQPPAPGGLQASDALLVLLPLAPIVQYVLNNPGLLSPRQVAILLVIFLVAALIMVLLVPALLSGSADVPLLRAIGMVTAFLLNNMAAMSADFKWFEQGNFAIQLGIGVGLVALASLLYRSRQRGLLLVLVVAFFASNTLLQIGRVEDSSSTQDINSHPLLAAGLPGEPASRPNVYLLIYDAYVPNETMRGYGLDNQAQEDYLRQQGFTLYPRTYSIGSYSVATMTPVLNASTEYYGPSRTGASGGGVVQQLFHTLGYQTYGIFPSDYFFRGIGSSYDVSFPNSRPAGSVLFDAILTGEFRFDIGFDAISASDYLSQKAYLFSNIPAEPVFLYSHSNFPGHTQNSGACLDDELESFQRKLNIANEEMQADLGLLLANDPDAIVIVAGDHGPYLTKNCYSLGGEYPLDAVTRLDIQDRFGTFLAIRWPGNDHAAYDDIVVLQDVFPAVFAYMYQDPALLQAHRVEPVTRYTPETISGAAVQDGLIVGGADDGEPLFLSE